MRRIKEKEGKTEKNTGVKRLFAPWVRWGVILCLVGAVVFTCFYDSFHANAKKWNGNLLERTDMISWLYQNTYLLYKDLYNIQHETQLDYREIYLNPQEGYEWLLDEEELSRRSDGIDETAGEEWMNREDDGESTLEEEAGAILREIRNLQGYFNNLEGNFRTLNGIFDYIIRDDVTGRYVTNMAEEEAMQLLESGRGSFFLLTFRFDSAGNVSMGEVCGENPDHLRKIANEITRENKLSSLVRSGMTCFKTYGNVGGPADCTVIYAASANYLVNLESAIHVYSDYFSSGEGNYYVYYTPYYAGDGVTVEAYRAVGLSGVLLCLILFFALLGLLLPVLGDTAPWDDNPVCSLPLEVLVFLGGCFLACISLLEEHVIFVSSGMAESVLAGSVGDPDLAEVMTAVYNLFVLTLFLFAFWYLGVCGRAVIRKGVRNYIKERSLIYRFFPFIKRKTLGFYNAIQHLDLTQDAHKEILKIVLVNAVVLFGICSLWFGGFVVTIIYSAVMYLVLRKYVSDLQKKYRILLRATNEMADGNLNLSIPEDLGVFEPFKPQIIRIQEGFRRAVDQEVKSQKMKAELITNVSHDLKTPLTAIITYVNLLKEEGIPQERRLEYLSVLERKSQRLKVLIEDLFEVSKANTQNITLNLAEVDIMNLIKQAAFEMTDKFQAAGLDVRMNLTEEKVLLSLDSQKTYRVYENLFGNIAKYAMEGTRVYVNGFRIDDTVVITLKNISAQEITVDSAELTERFVRGDVSRNTEGSGLGLAIAKSFVELQGGQLTLEVDGDLFKATTVWKQQRER